MKQRPFLFYSMLVAAMLTWGLSWASGKYLSALASSEVLIFYRFLFTFLSMIPVVLLVDKNWKISREALGLVIAGGLLMSGYNYLFFQGLQNGLAGAGGVLVTTLNPVFTFLFASILYKNRPAAKEITGLVLGITGSMIMIHLWRFSWPELSKSGNLFFIGASFAWAFMTLTSQRSAARISLLKFTMYVHGAAAFLSFLTAQFSSENGRFVESLQDAWNFPASFWLNLLYLSIISTSFGTTVYFEASRALGSKTASSFIFLVPLTALLGGMFFLNETFDFSLYAGGALSLAAVYLINSRRKPHPEKSFST